MGDNPARKFRFLDAYPVDMGPHSFRIHQYISATSMKAYLQHMSHCLDGFQMGMDKHTAQRHRDRLASCRAAPTVGCRPAEVGLEAAQLVAQAVGSTGPIADFA